MGWQPHPGPQTDFCSRGEFEVLYGGAAGGGKTDCIIMEALRDVHKPGYKGIILRRTFPELEEMMLRMEQFYPLLGGHYQSGSKRWKFPAESYIKVGHMQLEKDKYKYKSDEFQFVGLDEASSFTGTQYLYMFSRCRSKHPNIKPRFRAGTNPGGEGHKFLKERFRIGNVTPGTTIVSKEGLTRVFIPAKLKDNPTLLQNDPDYIKRLMALPEIERLRLLEGVWDAFEGQAIPELNMDVHGIEPFDIPPEWPRYRTMDWGYATPFAVGWWAVDPNGVLFRYREWYGSKGGETPNTGLRMTASEVARGILEREKPERERGISVRPGPADPDMWNPRWATMGKGKSLGVVGSSPAEDMMKEGVHFIQADNERALGRQSVHKRLELDEEGNPQMYIFTTLSDFWRTMPQLREWDTNPEIIENKNVEDHIFSEVRYMCMFRPVKPTYKVAENIGSFQAERAKAIKARQMMERFR